MAKRAGRKDALEVEKAAQAGDDLAVRAIEEAGKHIGVGIANLVNLLNPELVIIGGGVANMGEMLFKPIREEVKARALKIASESLKIVKAELGTEAGLLGAIALCL